MHARIKFVSGDDHIVVGEVTCHGVVYTLPDGRKLMHDVGKGTWRAEPALPLAETIKLANDLGLRDY